MASSNAVTGEETHFQPMQSDVIEDGDVSREDSNDAGDSVDAPISCQEEHSNTTLADDDNNSRQKVHDSFVPPTESNSTELSTAESTDTLDKGDKNQEPNSDGVKYSISSLQQIDYKKASTVPIPDIDVMPSNSLFHTPDLFGNDAKENPNVYWLGTEFARLVSDKKKPVKTTVEMRKEMRAIGLGNVELSSSGTKSIQDIMREYGLKPSADLTYSSGSMLGIKRAWMPKAKYSVVNVSQNNDTLDDTKANGSSVDGEYDYMLRRHGSNTSFANVASSRENVNPYAESKLLSRQQSLSYYDFKNDFKSTGSSTNLDSVTPSKANLDLKKVDEKSINPSLYFQRERERLQRLDTVMSRTPKNSYTSISHHNSWDLTDSMFGALRRPPSQRSSYLNMDTSLRFPEEERDWGNSSPTRSYLQRAATITASSNQYSPVTHYPQYQSHENPIFRNSTSFSSTLPGRHYSRNAVSPVKHSTTRNSGSTREPSVSTKITTKQSSPNERSASKSHGENSRGYKSSKMKPRQSKSCNSKPKLLDNVDKDEVIAKLMKNYSNSHVMAEHETGLMNPGRDFISLWREYEDPIRRYDLNPSTLQSEPSGRHRNDAKLKNGKYKPYQQNVVSMKKDPSDKSKDDTNITALSRFNMPMTWPGSYDPSQYTLEDENSSGSQAQNITSTRNSRDGKSPPNAYKFGILQNSTSLTNYSATTANSDSSRGGRVGIHGGLMENSSSQMLNHSEDLAVDENTSHFINSIGELDLKTNQADGKSKITKKRKFVPKRKPVKRK